jgi:hypothetical protein
MRILEYRILRFMAGLKVRIADELSQEFHPAKGACSPWKKPYSEPSGGVQADSVADAHISSSNPFKDGKQFGIYLHGPGENSGICSYKVIVNK